MSAERSVMPARLKACGSCGAPIVWLLTKNAKLMPVDAAAVEPQDREYDHRRHKSHFARCPHAKQHRVRR